MLRVRMRVLFWQPARLADGFGHEQAALSIRTDKLANAIRKRRAA